MNKGILLNELEQILHIVDEILSAKSEDLEEDELKSILQNCIANIVSDSLILKTFERSCKQYFENPFILDVEKSTFLRSYYELTNRKCVSYSNIDGEYYANYPDICICSEVFKSSLFKTTPGVIISIDIIRKYDAELDFILDDRFSQWDDDIMPNVTDIMSHLTTLLARIYNRGKVSLLEKVYLDKDYLNHYQDLKKINEAQRAKDYTLSILNDYFSSKDSLRLFAEDIYSLVLKRKCPEHIHIVNNPSEISREVLRAFIFNVYDSFERKKDWRKECASLIIRAFNIPNVRSIEDSDTYKKMTEKSPKIPRKKI